VDVSVPEDSVSAGVVGELSGESNGEMETPSGLSSGEIAAGREEIVDGTLAVAGLLKPKLWLTIPKTSAMLRHVVRDSIMCPLEGLMFYGWC
jgi:hypothetical protein